MPRQLDRDFGTCLSFDGATTDVTVTSQLFYQNTGYTVSLWAKPNAANSQRPLCMGSTASNNQVWIMNLGTDSANRIGFLIRDDGNGVRLIQSTVSTTRFVPGEWIHVVFTDNNGTCVLYINGVADATNFNYTRTGTFTFNRTAIGALVRAATSAWFRGLIDDVRIYNNTVLTAQQVSDLYYLGANPSTPTSWYKMDEGSGTTATDSGSLATNGNITAATYSTDVFMKPRTAVVNRQRDRDFGTCLRFDGANDFITVTGSASINVSTLTHTAWIKVLGTGNRAIIGGTKASGVRCPEFRVDGNNKLELLEQSVASIATSTGSVPLGIWTFVSVSYSASGVWTFYINGVASGTGTNLRSLAFANTLIGKQLVAENFNGKLDDVRIYGRVLTSTEISNLYYGIEPVTTNLGGWWKLDEGSGTSATDSSGNSNTGTITTATYSTDVFMKPRTLIT